MEKAPNRIKELREDRGWSVRELADRCKLNFNTVNRLENGVVSLDVEKMRRISSAFGLPASALLNDDDVEFRAGDLGGEIMSILKDIPEPEKYAMIVAAREIVRTATMLAAQRSAGALHGRDQQVGALADIWNDFDDQRRDRALDLLRVSGLR